MGCEIDFDTTLAIRECHNSYKHSEEYNCSLKFVNILLYIANNTICKVIKVRYGSEAFQLAP